MSFNEVHFFSGTCDFFRRSKPAELSPTARPAQIWSIMAMHALRAEGQLAAYNPQRTAVSRHGLCSLNTPSRRQYRVRQCERPCPIVAAAAPGSGEAETPPARRAAAAATTKSPPLPARKFVFAVDGKPDCEQALRWAASNIFSKGE
jgi:hypothetical protein